MPEKCRIGLSFTTRVSSLFFNFMTNFIIYFYLDLDFFIILFLLDLIREEKQLSKYIWIYTSNVAKFLFIFYLKMV